MASTKHGTFHWNELMTYDVDAAVKFYQDVIGWKIESMPMPDGIYHVAMVDGEPVAGIMNMVPGVPEGTPSHWMGYLAVDDIDERLKQAVEAGANVLREPMDIPDIGRFAILRDGGGAAIGWITPAQSS